MPMGLCSSPVSAPAAAGTRDHELGRLTQQRSFLRSLGGWTSEVMDVQGQGVQLTLRSKQSSAAHRAAPASEGRGLPLAAGARSCRRNVAVEAAGPSVVLHLLCSSRWPRPGDGAPSSPGPGRVPGPSGSWRGGSQMWVVRPHGVLTCETGPGTPNSHGRRRAPSQPHAGTALRCSGPARTPAPPATPPRAVGGSSRPLCRGRSRGSEVGCVNLWLLSRGPASASRPAASGVQLWPQQRPCPCDRARPPPGALVCGLPSQLLTFLPSQHILWALTCSGACRADSAAHGVCWSSQ